MNALKWITREAKRLRAEYPNRYKHLANPWRDGYMAQASAIYAQKHKGKSPVGHPKKKSTPKKTQRMPAKKAKRKSHIGAINQHIKMAREGMEQQLKDKMLAQYKAPTKTKKKKIGKQITELKRDLNRLKK